MKRFKRILSGIAIAILNLLVIILVVRVVWINNPEALWKAFWFMLGVTITFIIYLTFFKVK